MRIEKAGGLYMKHTLHAALAGGDVRQVYLGQLLLQHGIKTETIGLERETQLPVCSDMRELFADSDVIILPLPVTREKSRLNAPLANKPYPLTAVLDAIPAGKPVYGGAVPKMVHDMAARRGIRVRDYLEREELALLNAIPTAEGAIQIAMEELPVTLHDLPVLVLGAGRIGSALAPRLRGLGASVTVAARKHSDLARLYSDGYATVHSEQLTGQMHEFPLIINTIPYPILTRTVLSDCQPEVCIIDLASGNGGIAADAQEIRHVIHALSLPGRVAPKTAASAIYQTIRHMLKEEGLL